MEIAYLNDRPEFARRLARLQAEEWQHLYREWDFAVAIAEFAVQHADGRWPTTLIALRGATLLGSVSVIHDDLPGWERLNPWLASLYVLEEFRGQGIGSALVGAVERLLVDASVGHAYLFTETGEAFFARLGWQRFADTTVLSYPAVVMHKVVQRSGESAR